MPRTMGIEAPPAGPVGPGEPSNRWPWLVVGIGALAIVIAVIAFFVIRGNSVNVTTGPTPAPAVSVASPSPPPTLVPPTLPPSASPQQSPLPPSPAPTSPPPSPPPSPTAILPTAAIPPTAAPEVASPAPTLVTPAAQPATAVSSPVAPSPAPFTGQVSAGGGLGNTRNDIDAAYGGPTGQTANGLVVYQKNNYEFHVQFVPDLQGRAAIIVQMPRQTAQLPTLQQAQSMAHALLPHDAQPPNQTPEGNDQFVVEHYTSQTLGEALPETFGASGQFMIVYVKAPQGTISHWILGPGTDPNALINASGG